MQAFAKEAGVVAIVSGNGNGDTFQIGDVMFTSDQNVENGNVEAMIQGVAFNAVRDAVRKALPTEIKETVLEYAELGSPICNIKVVAFSSVAGDIPCNDDASWIHFSPVPGLSFDIKFEFAIYFYKLFFIFILYFNCYLITSKCRSTNCT